MAPPHKKTGKGKKAKEAEAAPAPAPAPVVLDEEEDVYREPIKRIVKP